MLKAGSYDVVILHDEPRGSRMQFNLQLVKTEKTGNSFKNLRTIAFHGRSLQGSQPKLVIAGPRAKVVRKWIDGFTVRPVYCLLPNKVIVAFNPEKAQVLQAWHSARFDQTPSLNDRSQAKSVIQGEPLAATLQGILLDGKVKQFSYLSSTIVDDNILMKLSIYGSPYSLTISPEGATGYKIKGASEKPIPGLSIKSSPNAVLKQDDPVNRNFEISLK